MNILIKKIALYGTSLKFKSMLYFFNCLFYIYIKQTNFNDTYIYR